VCVPTNAEPKAGRAAPERWRAQPAMREERKQAGRRSAAALLLALAACSTKQTAVLPEGGWQRMLTQPRYEPYRPSPFFTDGRAMQLPPAGTVSDRHAVGEPAETRGYAGDLYTRQLPVHVDASLVKRGRERFEIICAACHGILGDGDSVVGKNMPLVQPRSLLLPRLRAYAAGRVFRVVREGFGLMPSYAAELDVNDGWAVVAYVRALQLSRAVPLASLPPALQAAARKALP
jgi:cytochrome c553